MQRTWSTRNLSHPIDEIERYLYVTRWLQQIQREMAENDQRSLMDFVAPSDDEPHLSIVHPTIEASNF